MVKMWQPLLRRKMQQRVCNEALGTCSHVSQQSWVPSKLAYFAFIFLWLQQGVSYGVSRSSCDNRFLSNIKNDCNYLSNSDEKAWCKVSTLSRTRSNDWYHRMELAVRMRWDRAVLYDFRFIVEVFILSEILEQAEYHKTDSITYTCI